MKLPSLGHGLEVGLIPSRIRVSCAAELLHGAFPVVSAFQSPCDYLRSLSAPLRFIGPTPLHPCQNYWRLWDSADDSGS